MSLSKQYVLFLSCANVISVEACDHLLRVLEHVAGNEICRDYPKATVDVLVSFVRSHHTFPSHLVVSAIAALSNLISTGQLAKATLSTGTIFAML